LVETINWKLDYSALELKEPSKSLGVKNKTV